MKKFFLVGLMGLLSIGLLVSCKKETKEKEEIETINKEEVELGIELVYVEGGTFTMGGTAEQGEVNDDELPIHEVTLASYYIGKYEITQAQWESVMGTTLQEQWEKAEFDYGFVGEGDDYPMYYVNWEDAMEFCDVLSKKTGHRYTLPTEAQWEYAARGGKYKTGTRYSGSDDMDEVAWVKENSGEKLHPVGKKKANALGIYDMSGNLFEFCSDYYAPYGEEIVENPEEEESTLTDRVVRGGNWLHPGVRSRVACREYFSYWYRSHTMGFRVVRLPE